MTLQDWLMISGFAVILLGLVTFSVVQIRRSEEHDIDGYREVAQEIDQIATELERNAHWSRQLAHKLREQHFANGFSEIIEREFYSVPQRERGE